MRSSGQRVVSALVADGAIDQVAALWDGNGDLRLDPGGPGGAGQHDGAEAAGALPDGVYGRAAAARRRRLRVVGRRDARRQPQRHSVSGGPPALPGGGDALQRDPGDHKDQTEHNERPHSATQFDYTL